MGECDATHNIVLSQLQVSQNEIIRKSETIKKYQHKFQQWMTKMVP